jgi:hypothetical protein
MNGLARLIPSKVEAVTRVLTFRIGRAEIVSAVFIDKFHTHMNVGGMMSTLRDMFRSLAALNTNSLNGVTARLHGPTR